MFSSQKSVKSLQHLAANKLYCRAEQLREDLAGTYILKVLEDLWYMPDKRILIFCETYNVLRIMSGLEYVS
jgi:hypothetical protein